MADPRLRSLEAELSGRVEATAAATDRVAGDTSHVRGRAIAVAAPADAEDVARLVRWARREKVPLVARGAGTSRDGESAAVDGGIVVDLSGWTEILEISPDERRARLRPGVVNADLQEAAGRHGLFFPPNPGSWERSTIGGNIATNASGMRSFRYGATRAWVRELDLVLGTGERVHLGSRAAKRSVGPDLLGLVVGSEGTLGVVTEASVALAPRPLVRRGLGLPLPEGIALGRLAAALASAPGTGLSAVEYLDAATARAMAEDRGSPWPVDSALLLLEIEAETPAEADQRGERLRAVLRAQGVDATPRVYEDADRLWSERGATGPLLESRYGLRVPEDVAVPLPEVDGFLTELRAILAREAVPMFLFGHLGEGSLHPNVIVDPVSPAAERIRGALYRAALGRHGTISAEHGIGVVKRDFLEEELGPAALRLLRDVKTACDPDGILNPGKLYPDAGGRAGAGASRSPSASAAGRAPPA